LSLLPLGLGVIRAKKLQSSPWNIKPINKAIRKEKLMLDAQYNIAC
jgi:hypothetical protein